MSLGRLLIMQTPIALRAIDPSLFTPSTRLAASSRLPQRKAVFPSSRLPCLSRFSALQHILLALTLLLFTCCPSITGLSERFCDPLLMAFVSIDQRSSHCLDSAWRLPPSSLVTLHFAVSRCSVSPGHPLATSAPSVGGYAIVTEGVFLLKRYRHFGPGDFGLALNDSFVLPREFAARTQPIPLEFLLIDDEDGVSSK